MAEFRPSQHQRRCLIAATIAPLRRYRKGFATSKFGPFYRRETVIPLLQAGALRKLPGGGPAAIRLTATAA